MPHARAGIGAVATQCYANPRLGSLILRLLESGLNANDALIKALNEDSGREERQLGVVSIRG